MATVGMRTAQVTGRQLSVIAEKQGGLNDASDLTGRR